MAGAAAGAEANDARGSVPAMNASMRTPGVPGGRGAPARVHRDEHDVGRHGQLLDRLVLHRLCQNSIQIGSAVRRAVLAAPEAERFLSSNPTHTPAARAGS